jgi:ABC-2 type transport system permease protein
MPALPPVFVIARLTVQEASRRRLLLALVILTLIVVGFSAWGFYKITTVAGPSGQPPTHEEVIIVSSQLLIFVTFVYSGVLALSAAVVAGPLISNEVESGLILSILARPVRRSEIVIGKWLGLAALVSIYAVGSAVLELTAVDWATTYVPPHPVALIVYVGLEGLTLLSLGLLLSTRLSGITGGVIALVAWLMAWIGGIVGDIGTGLQNEAVQDVGIVSRLVLPTDGLWRGAINAMEPDVFLAQLRAAGAFARANPFAALDPPPTAFLVWVAVWFAVALFLAIWSFRTREI